MPIRVTCQCGQSFAAPDHLAGKRVKCPKCSQPLAIPAATAPAASITGGQAASATRPPAKKPAPPPDLDDDDPFGDLAAPAAAPRDLFAEAGLNQRAAGTVPCPSCGKGMKQEAVLCVNCGFHRGTGKKVQGAMVASSGGGDDHNDGGGAEMLLRRAAERIADEKAEEAKTRSEGMPAWGYALLLLGVICLAAIFMVNGIGAGFVWAGTMSGVFCSMAQLYYSIQILINAFNRAPAQGIMCLLIPFYLFYYSYQHWDEVGTTFTNMLYFWLAGFACGFVYWMGIAILVAFPTTSSDPEASLLWQVAKTVLAA